MEIPSYLRGTADLVTRAFPHGVPAEHYLPLLFFMTEYLCDEHVAILADTWKSKDAESSLNDVYIAKSTTPDCAAVVRLLEASGLKEWLAENDG